MIAASVVIVNWNTGPLLRRCLDRLPQAFRDSQPYEVLVVDNGSTDNSIALAEGSVQRFQSFPMRANLGFARANNVGIRQAKGDVIILLNPDTEPLPGSMGAILDALRAHPRAAAIGPRLLNPAGTLQRSCRRFPTPGTFVLLFLKGHRVAPRLSVLRRYFMEDFAHDTERRVDQIMGACMAIPREALDRIGLFDERYWIWFEEVDWCRRATEAGWEVWFTPRAEIIHHGGASFQQVLPVQKEWRFVRSSLRYALRYLGLFAWLILLPLVPVALLLDTGAFVPWIHRLSQRVRRGEGHQQGRTS